MILEEIQNEIDQQTNRLVIDKVASLLADPNRWEELFNVIDAIPSNFFSQDSNEWIQIEYVRTLRAYVRDKIKLSKASRQATQFDWPESHKFYLFMIQAEKDLRYSNYLKLCARQRMVDACLDYKKYHNNITTRL